MKLEFYWAYFEEKLPHISSYVLSFLDYFFEQRARYMKVFQIFIILISAVTWGGILKVQESSYIIEQGWHSDENAHLSPICPRFDSGPTST